jgi:hypothetical protein
MVSVSGGFSGEMGGQSPRPREKFSLKTAGKSYLGALCQKATMKIPGPPKTENPPLVSVLICFGINRMKIQFSASVTPSGAIALFVAFPLICDGGLSN